MTEQLRRIFPWGMRTGGDSMRDRVVKPVLEKLPVTRNPWVLPILRNPHVANDEVEAEQA